MQAHQRWRWAIWAHRRGKAGGEAAGCGESALLERDFGAAVLAGLVVLLARPGAGLPGALGIKGAAARVLLAINYNSR